MKNISKIFLWALVAALAVACLSSAEAQAAQEPTNAEEAKAQAAARKTAREAAVAEKYKAWVATLPPERQAWEKVLQENLGSFYLPGHQADKLAGKSNAWDYVQDDPKLPRVLIIGDSVSRGYTLAARKYLAGKANVHRAPENCGGTSRGLSKIEIWLGDGRWDVIHFNFGIHDRGTKISDYTNRLEKLITRMQKTGAKLVWASTTPIPDDPAQKQTAASIVERNKAAAELMKKFNIPVDDLFSAVTPHLSEYQQPNNVHFKEAGYDFLGQRVGAAIEATLPGKPLAAVEKDPRVQSDGKPWGINKSTVRDQTRPRVLLIGDSILNGYANTVIKQLAGIAYVDYWVTPACQSEGFNKMLAVVLKNGPYDVIHINLGLHGFQKDRIVKGQTEKQPRIPPDQFEPLTKAFIEVMRKENPQARIIWASTTPITLRDKPAELDPQSNPIIIEHNRMAARVMAEMNVPVNDLYGLMINHLDLKQNDFHWKDAAKKIQGNAVADSVRKLLPAKRQTTASNDAPAKP